MRQRPLPSSSTRSRLAGATLAAILALIAVAGAWHEHAFLLEGFHLCAPTAAAPPTHQHDCLACKIAPPCATPWSASALLDPGIASRQPLAPHGSQADPYAATDPAAPRGPPLLPQA